MKDMPLDRCQDLSGIWALRDAAGGDAVEMAVPGDAISALVTAGRLPDPYIGQNEDLCSQVAARDWVLHRTVHLDDPDRLLVVDGVDTVATIRWNGQVVLQAENAFRTHRVPLSGVARAGENEIEITFPTVTREASRRQAAQPFHVPFSENCPIPDGNMLRKPACDFGWDWNPALLPFGITGGIWLEPVRAVRIAGIKVVQGHRETSVDLAIHTILEGDRFEEDVHVTFDGVTETLKATGAEVVARFSVEDPKLWWPAGQGVQNLYTLTVACGDQVETRKIGLRDIKLISEPDEIGRSFQIAVNGRKLFCKGANWVPADALPGRVTPAQTRALLQSAVDANMNMIRVWGGGRYEPDWFYDLCDSLGLMVWQDAMFACSLYPSDDAFLSEVAAEITETALRLNHHACLALWCGDNELIGALTWYPESVANRDRYLVAYDRLNRTIEAALQDTLPNANWWPSSPSPGPMNFGDAWHDDRSGDMHFWSVWHEGREFDHYRDVAPRFCSEFGFQSYPSMEVIRQFAEPEDFNIAAPVLEAHQKNLGGNARIAETMFRYFRFPEGFENFVYLSQVQQALAIETAVRHWRAQKPRCMGTLYWQLNDTWPCASWSSLDHGGGWKLLHHAARRFYAPVTMTVCPKEAAFDIVAVADTPTAIDMQCCVLALAMSGATRRLAEFEGTVSPDAAVHMGQIAVDALAPDELLYLSWQSAAGTDDLHFAPRPYKTYGLRPPNLELTTRQEGGHHRLTITSETLALFVSVEASQPGRFSDNAMLLRPGTTTELTFHPVDPGGDVAFKLRDLHSATYPKA